MDEDLEQQLDRREFIRRLMRYLISSGLVVSTSALIFKRIRVSNDETCFNYFICQDCKKLFNCNLPSALKTKENFESDKYAR